MEQRRARRGSRRASTGSRLESGSSSRNACGSRTIARPSATRWRWPPDSCAGLRSSSAVDAQRCGHLAARVRRSRAVGDAAHPQPERQVLAHGLVRIQRVALEHHRQIASLRRHAGHVAPVDQDAPARRRLETGDQPQHRALAAARRPDQHQQLAVARSRGRGRAPPRRPFGKDLADALERRSTPSTLHRAGRQARDDAALRKRRRAPRPGRSRRRAPRGSDPTAPDTARGTARSRPARSAARVRA